MANSISGLQKLITRKGGTGITRKWVYGKYINKSAIRVQAPHICLCGPRWIAVEERERHPAKNNYSAQGRRMPGRIKGGVALHASNHCCMRILASALGACTPARRWRDQALGGNLCTPRGASSTRSLAQTPPRRKPLPHMLPYGSYRYSAKQG